MADSATEYINPVPPWEASGCFPGLIWGYDIIDGKASPVREQDAPAGAFRWLHVSLADGRSRRWLASYSAIPPLARELLLGGEEHPRALVDEDDAIACVIQDWSRDFDDGAQEALRTLRFALTADLMVTARQAPIGSADVIKRRLDQGLGPTGAGGALDLLIGVALDEANSRLTQLQRSAQEMEDALLESDREPTTLATRLLRRRAVQVQRQTSGVHGVLHRLENDESLSEALLPPVERLVQRAIGLERDAVALIGQERLLREELGVRAAERANRNLYALSVMTALMLPPTLVAGLFGMNTGGLPFAHGSGGTLAACVIGLLSAAGSYLLLRQLGFFRNGGR